MKKTFGIIILAVLILLCSCSRQTGICYYGFLGNEAAVFIYSNSKNTVYEVKLPIELIIEWGELNQINAVDHAVIKFCGLDGDGIIACSALNWKSACCILDAMNDSTNNGPESRLKTYIDNAVRFSQDPLASSFGKLIGTDLRTVAKVFAEKKPDVYCLDATQYNDSQEVEKVQRFIQSWLEQVLAEDTNERRNIEKSKGN